MAENEPATCRDSASLVCLVVVVRCGRCRGYQAIPGRWQTFFNNSGVALNFVAYKERPLSESRDTEVDDIYG
jgi:hypothetical protein